MRWMLPLGAAAFAVLSSACTASINDDAPGSMPPGTVGPGAAGTTGASGASGAGGGASAGGGGGAPAQLPEFRVLRRLNRAEYNNTVHDLLGTSLRPADKLPEEAAADGFDTNGEALTIGVAHVSRFEEAAGQLIDELYALPETDERRRAVLVCKLEAGAEAACARQIFSGFARRAFRRPVVQAEIDRLLLLVEKVRALGETYEGAVKAALTSILVSPNFLFMVEKGELAPGVVKPLDDHELATRLSYFLWSSMPDTALFSAAEAGALKGDPVKFAGEVERMLGDSKAEALSRDFGGQWLTLRRLELVAPSVKTFPTYDDSLRDAAWRESELFLAALIKENAPVESLLTAKFTFVNQRLAQHYGLSASGMDFQRVDLANTERLGILGHASVLMANSQPGWTSPTKRGAWVLEQLLCAPPPPVPDDLMIEPLPEPPPGQTKREQLELHRKEERCAGCHALMDPIGLGLENFDAIGGYRTVDNTKPVDASGVLEGKPFAGLRELTDLLKTDERLSGCFARQLLTYAVGRSFHSASGQSDVSALVQSVSSGGHPGMHDLIEAVVRSEAFRTRRGQ
jgi:hypothetical protein